MGLRYIFEVYYSRLKLLNTSTIPFTGHLINILGSITYFSKLGRVFHSPTKTYKKNNTLLGVFSRHPGLNYFGLDYQSGIANGYKYSMHMQYLL